MDNMHRSVLLQSPLSLTNQWHCQSVQDNIGCQQKARLTTACNVIRPRGHLFFDKRRLSETAGDPIELFVC